MRYAGALLALLTVACATPSTWDRPGATEREREVELAACRFEVAKIPNQVLAPQALRDCMMSKGWNNVSR